MELGWVIFFVAIIAVIMVLCASPAHSVEPEFKDYVVLKKTQPAPVDGFLMTQASLSTIMARYKALELKCAKDVEFQLGSCALKIGELDEKCGVNLKATTKRYDGLLQIKDAEIIKLRNLPRSGLYKFWDTPLWVGVVVSAIVTSITLYGVHYAIER
jgi:hypothetical protein